MSVEHRLVVLAVTKMDFLNNENVLLKREVKLLDSMNINNVAFIRQLVADKQDYEEKMSKERSNKKKWRNATLLIGGIYAITITVLLL